ncbi:hypothetical protein J2X19_005144 [Rhodoferax ferrireducens]|uniref:Uncharacterized protein n=1 Tax=Rhodoferax ferrireducens TaxID=192843 RepID=A0ABU2CGI8_9BURK|nr:hypothetical protein [Rhodoferax ferrireducens]
MTADEALIIHFDDVFVYETLNYKCQHAKTKGHEKAP